MKINNNIRIEQLDAVTGGKRKYAPSGMISILKTNTDGNDVLRMAKLEKPDKNEKVELNVNELGKISGGWIYDGPVDWLKGTDIKCPYCGADDEETVHYCGRSRMFIGFGCSKCKQQFNYELFYGKVYVSK